MKWWKTCCCFALLFFFINSDSALEKSEFQAGPTTTFAGPQENQSSGFCSKISKNFNTVTTNISQTWGPLRVFCGFKHHFTLFLSLGMRPRAVRPCWTWQLEGTLLLVEALPLSPCQASQGNHEVSATKPGRQSGSLTCSHRKDWGFSFSS